MTRPTTARPLIRLFSGFRMLMVPSRFDGVLGDDDAGALADGMPGALVLAGDLRVRGLQLGFGDPVVVGDVLEGGFAVRGHGVLLDDFLPASSSAAAAASGALQV